MDSTRARRINTDGFWVLYHQPRELEHPEELGARFHEVFGPPRVVMLDDKPGVLLPARAPQTVAAEENLKRALLLTEAALRDLSLLSD